MCPVTYCLAVRPRGHASAAWPMSPWPAALRPIGSCGLAVQMPVYIIGAGERPRGPEGGQGEKTQTRAPFLRDQKGLRGRARDLGNLGPVLTDAVLTNVRPFGALGMVLLHQSSPAYA